MTKTVVDRETLRALADEGNELALDRLADLVLRHRGFDRLGVHFEPEPEPEPEPDRFTIAVSMAAIRSSTERPAAKDSLARHSARQASRIAADSVAERQAIR